MNYGLHLATVSSQLPDSHLQGVAHAIRPAVSSHISPGRRRLRPWRRELVARLRGEREAPRRVGRRRRQRVVGPHRGRGQPAGRGRRPVRHRRNRRAPGPGGREVPGRERRSPTGGSCSTRPKEFDAVIVSTPDHMHAPIALPAMQLGKHVFCQKPLTHTVFEARQMRLAAKKYGVVTQMGNQIQSHEAYRTAVKLVHDGAIGKVKEVHSWQAGAMRWMLVDDRPPGATRSRRRSTGTTGSASPRSGRTRRRSITPFNWRAWQDFSNGQLGDFGCHILDPVFMALGLTAPLTVQRRGAAAQPRGVVQVVGGRVRVPRHRAHGGQDAQAHLVRRRGQAAAARASSAWRRTSSCRARARCWSARRDRC